MADFLNDYSGIAAAGSAFEGFAKGFQDAQDRKMKRLQTQAEMDALQTRMEREKTQSSLEAYKAHLNLGPGGEITERPQSPSEQLAQRIGAKEKGVNVGAPDESGVPSVSYDPGSPAMINAQKKGMLTDKDLAGLALKAALGGVSPTNPNDKGVPSGYVVNPDSLASKKVTNQKEANTGRLALAKEGSKRQDARLDLQNQRFGETQDQNAIKAGKAIEEDSVIKGAVTARNSLARGKSLLEGDMPLTYNNLNAVQQDVINGMVSGGVSSEGKVNREMQESWKGAWNNLMAKAGRYGPDHDIRKEDPGLYNQIKGLLAEVDSSIAKNISDRTKTLSSSYSETTNSRVKKIIDQKVKQYAAPEAPPATQGLVPQGLVQGQPGLVRPGAQLNAHPQDAAAVQWAQGVLKKNPNDQKALTILKANGY